MADILIMGGGIAGLLTARELVQAGARVTLLERNRRAARESSWAGGGILSPLYPWRYAESVTRLSLWSQQHWAQLCTALQETTGIDPQFTASGLLIHAPEEESAAADWARRCHQQMETVTRAQIRQLEPERKAPPPAMLWFPAIAQVRNPRLVKSLVADLERQGVRLHLDTRVTGIQSSRHGITLTSADGRRWQADKAVVCAGAWSGRLLRGLLSPPPDIRPLRGQMLLFRTRPGLIRHMMLEENRYIIPRRDGRVLFGSTLEEAGFDKTPTREAREALQRLAHSRFPALADYPLEAHWAGLRPAAPAGIPYIGQLPDSHGRLFINAGHFRNGVVLGPASARLVSDLLLERPPILDPAPYVPDAPRHHSPGR